MKAGLFVEKFPIRKREAVTLREFAERCGVSIREARSAIHAARCLGLGILSENGRFWWEINDYEAIKEFAGRRLRMAGRQRKASAGQWVRREAQAMLTGREN